MRPLPTFSRKYEDLAKEVSKFLGEPLDLVMAKAMRGSENVREGWANHLPETPEDLRAFYGAEDNGYFYDLLAWNTSPFYHSITKPLYEANDEHVLVVGAGLGEEVDRLRGRNTVDVFELPGALKDFVTKRFHDDQTVEILDGKTLQEVASDPDLAGSFDRMGKYIRFS